ncbi:UNVERIFIED_CONTAM: hypothetical protein GTU68_014396 [Idotea baltica]|nr:hypothetical protein [Idotea baltica]
MESTTKKSTGRKKV